MGEPKEQEDPGLLKVRYVARPRSADKQALIIADTDDAGADDPEEEKDSPKWFQSRYYARVKELDRLDDVLREKKNA